MKKLILGTILLSSTQVFSQSRSDTSTNKLEKVQIETARPIKKNESVRNLKAQILKLTDQRVGNEGGGGGNTIAGQLIESYRVEMVDSKMAIAGKVQEALNKISEKTPAFGSRISQTLRKTWYFVPVRLNTLSEEVTGLRISTDQVAVQTQQFVWVDKNIFDSMSATEQVKLIMHELIMGDVFIRFGGKYKSSAELHDLVRELTDTFVSNIDQWTAMGLSDLLKQRDYYASNEDPELNENGDDINLDNPDNDPDKVDAGPLFQKLAMAFANGQKVKIEEAFPKCQDNGARIVDNKLRILALPIYESAKFYSFQKPVEMPCSVSINLEDRTSQGVGNLFKPTILKDKEQFVLESLHSVFWKNGTTRKTTVAELVRMDKEYFYNTPEYLSRTGACTGEVGCGEMGRRNDYTTIKSTNSNGEEIVTERYETACKDASGIFPYVKEISVRKYNNEFIIRESSTNCTKRGANIISYKYSGYWNN